jgi:hypothetical protein
MFPNHKEAELDISLTLETSDGHKMPWQEFESKLGSFESEDFSGRMFVDCWTVDVNLEKGKEIFVGCLRATCLIDGSKSSFWHSFDPLGFREDITWDSKDCIGIYIGKTSGTKSYDHHDSAWILVLDRVGEVWERIGTTELIYYDYPDKDKWDLAKIIAGLLTR